MTAEGLRIELTGSWRLAADRHSFMRLALDALGYRAQRVVRIGDRAQHHRVRFKDGTELTYRLNRGDVRAIGEVWMSEAYRLPFEIRPRNIIDVGANIGVASVWLIGRYGGSRVVAVEPAPDNAELARLNLERNRITAEVVQAAIGPRAGTARFGLNSNSTLGRIEDEGIEVDLVTPQSLVDRFPAQERIDLVKIDVEGAEQELFEGDLGWLARVDCLVVELHADRIDCDAVISTLTSEGFSHVPIGEDNKYRGLADVMVAFRRT
ncbi:MAG TPA: FkbM family methyltransferase [Solirubrobacteraceae bacterium]